jgi:predicted RNase H-like nuclease (RuvC/YqgF family)
MANSKRIRNMENENKQEAENMSATVNGLSQELAALKGEVEKMKQRNKYENLYERLSRVQDAVTRQCRELEELSRPVPNPLGKSFNLKMLGYISAGAIVFFAVAVLAKEFFCFYITGDSIVMTLIGILATFVVVNNYAQVTEIKSEFAGIEQRVKQQAEEKVEKLEKDLSKYIDRSNGNFMEEWRKDDYLLERIVRLEKLLKDKPEQTINDKEI